MTSDGAEMGGGGVWRKCNFQISKIVDSSFNAECQARRHQVPSLQSLE